MSAENVLSRKVRTALDEAGFVFVRRTKHLIYFHPIIRKTITISCSAHCHHAERNTLADIKRAIRCQ